MKYFVALFFPGFLQAKEGEGSQAFFWNLPWALLIVLLIFLPVNKSEGIEGISSITLFSTTLSFLTFKALVALAFYFLSAIFACIDFSIKGQNEAVVDLASEHKSWESIMTVYLKNNFTECLKLTEDQVKKNKKDSFSHYMMARLLSQKGEREKAQKFLKLCRKFDKDLYLLWECDQLQKNMPH